MMELKWFVASEDPHDLDYYALVNYDESYGDNYRQRLFRIITIYEELNVDNRMPDCWVCMDDIDSIFSFDFDKYCKDMGVVYDSGNIEIRNETKYLLHSTYMKMLSHVLLHEPKSEIRDKAFYLLKVIEALPVNIRATKDQVLKPKTQKSEDTEKENILIRWSGRPINHELEATYGIIASGFANFELNKGTPSVQNGAIAMHVLYNSDSKYGYDFYCESGLIKYIERRAPKGIKELPVIKTFEAYGKDYGVDRFYNVDDAIKFLKDDNKTDNTIYKLLCNIRYEWNVREVIGKLRRSADEYFNDHYEDTYSD